ncbi:MAG: N-acetylmuramoyl-L-alanine amidase [Lachnospiraceae bacterium]|nr:N-acetylmuramoyl-L-alanine amidase [Lachnospiraceae bacterium]
MPDQTGNIIIVIDPGHGGESLGGNYEDRIERDIDLITAEAMKERLEQYDNVIVYLTRENNEDRELTRKERFEFAQKVNADFLYSIHYNMSEYHTLFGAEVWVCSSGENSAKGMTFAEIEMKELTGLGLFDRGIKCRLDKKGGEYYGILRYSQEFNIPAVIIEHCHLDEERDSAFWNNEAYREFGRIDADCAAKYFGLSSTSLNVDFSTYEKHEYPVSAETLQPDSTPPGYCNAQMLDTDGLTARIRVSSADEDDYIQYYSYSLDGGVNFSRLEAWEDRNSEFQEFDVDLNENRSTDLVVRTFNKYDLYTDSEIVELPQAVIVIEQEDVLPDETGYTDISYNTEVPVNTEPVTDHFRLFIGSIIACLILIFLISLTVSIRQRRKRRKRRKNKKHET